MPPAKPELRAGSKPLCDNNIATRPDSRRRPAVTGDIALWSIQRPRMAKRRKDKNDKNKDAVVDVVIETPKGSRNKFSYKDEDGQFRLTKVLPQGMVFPYDFGFVPGTRAEDGDPLDVLVLMAEPAFPGCVVECALIGVIEAEQAKDEEKYRNDRVLAVATSSDLYADVRDISDLNQAVLDQIEKFFVNYQHVEGVGYEVLDRKGRDAAIETVRKNRKRKKAA